VGEGWKAYSQKPLGQKNEEFNEVIISEELKGQEFSGFRCISARDSPSDWADKFHGLNIAHTGTSVRLGPTDSIDA
jgi:hypothetical protein